MYQTYIKKVIMLIFENRMNDEYYSLEIKLNIGTVIFSQEMINLIKNNDYDLNYLYINPYMSLSRKNDGYYLCCEGPNGGLYFSGVTDLMEYEINSLIEYIKNLN